MGHDLIFCVDGGGTKTRARLLHRNGTELARAESGPCNISTNPTLAAANVTGVWRECVRQSELSHVRPSEILMSIGAAGATSAGPRAVFLNECLEFGRILLITDGYAALIGAGGGCPCGLIVAGTGAVGHRLYADGRSIRRDGWGWVAGDRGSGAWIGRKALRHAIEVYDGLAPIDRLADCVLAKLESRGGVQHGLLGIGPHQIASFAPLVFTAATEGESVALDIIDRALFHLARLVHLLDLEHDTPLYISGGLGPLLRSGLSARLQRDLLLPNSDPVHGCYLVATEVAPIEDVALTAFKHGRH